jgi:hypothetical protein
MNMMKSHQFLLKQHTPLVHFQPQTEGATLRATELRPLIDRYLIENIFKNQLAQFDSFLLKLDEEKAKSWQKKGKIYKWNFAERLAFDYKIQIEPIGKIDVSLDIEKNRENKPETNNFPLLLANMGGKESESELKNLIMHKGVLVTIQTRHEALLEKIKIVLPAVVGKNCFGNRSGKGFGSFTCINMPKQKSEFRYRFIRNFGTANENKQQLNLFTDIDLFYKTIRSGINYGHRNFYFKSLLYRFAKDVLNEQWDKRTIKERYFTGNSTISSIDHRDHLGLSTNEKWGNRGTITKSGGDGFRYASPIIFKPIRLSENQFEVWFDFENDTDTIEKFKNIEIEIKKDGGGNLKLKPSANFSMQKYFNFLFEIMDLESLDDHVIEFDNKNLNCVKNEIYTKQIRPIFESIYKNLEKTVAE